MTESLKTQVERFMAPAPTELEQLYGHYFAPPTELFEMDAFKQVSAFSDDVVRGYTSDCTQDVSFDRA